MRVALLSALSLVFASPAHAIDLDWHSLSCSGYAAQIFHAAPFAPEAGVDRIRVSRDGGRVSLVVKKSGGSTTFFLERARDEVDNLGRVTQAYENDSVHMKLSYEGEETTKLAILRTGKSRKKLILRANCVGN